MSGDSSKPSQLDFQELSSNSSRCHLLVLTQAFTSNLREDRVLARTDSETQREGRLVSPT